MSTETSGTTVNAQAQDTDVYDGVKITNMKKDIVEYLARNPGATNREVAESVGCSISYPSPVRDEFGHLIMERAKELGSDLDKLDESIERRQKKRADSWSNLTTKQRSVLRRLAEEDNPDDPDSTLRAIIEDLDFEDHPSSILDIKNKYAKYAKKLKKARQVASEGEDPETLIDEISLDEEDETHIVGRESVSEDSPTETEEVDSQEPTPQSAFEALYAEIQAHKEMAEAEMEYTDSGFAAGRLVMAKQIENKMNELTQ